MDVVSPELPQFIRLLLALGFVLALMGGFALLVKKLGLSAQMPTKRGADKRLEVIESLPIDARRRLAIIRCDDKEHLVVFGANSETVIDRDIQTVDDSANSKSSA